MKKTNSLSEKVEEAKTRDKEIMKIPPSIYSFGRAYQKYEEKRLARNAIKYGNYSRRKK